MVKLNEEPTVLTPERIIPKMQGVGNFVGGENPIPSETVEVFQTEFTNNKALEDIDKYEPDLSKL